MSPVLNCVQSNKNLLTMHAILSLVILIKRFSDQESLTSESLRLILAAKTKNHLAIFESHFGRIVKNYETQA